MSSDTINKKTGQTWNTEAYAANGRFVANLASAVVDLLNPQPGEEILDLGCGDGALTEQLAASGRTSIAADMELAKVLYRTAGYRVCGERAVRVDILERLADTIRAALT